MESSLAPGREASEVRPVSPVGATTAPRRAPHQTNENSVLYSYAHSSGARFSTTTLAATTYHDTDLSNVLVAATAGPHGEFVGAVAGKEQMRVAVDEARHDGPAAGIDDGGANGDGSPSTS